MASLLGSARELLSQWSSVGALIEQGPIRQKQLQIANPNRFEGACEPRECHLIQHSLWEAYGGVSAIPLDGSCDVPPYGVKGESPLWVSAVSADL